MVAAKRRGGRGRDLENRMARIHGDAQKAARAYVVHVPTPVQITSSKNGRIRGHLRNAVAPDFVGVVAGGRAVVGEAKQTKRARGWYRSMLTDHQSRSLQLAARLGAISWVIVGHSATGNTYLLPWSEDGAPFTGACLQWGDAEQWKVPVGKTWIDATGDWAAYCARGWV